MPVVTGVKERRGRATLFVDGEPWAELDPAVVAERGLFEGVELSQEELADARVEGEKPLAMNRAFYALGYRARSKGELRQRLRRGGYAEATVDEVVQRLEEMGYLDDEEFAKTTVRDKASKYGPHRIYSDLRRAGVNGETAQGAVEEEFAGRSELEAALVAVQRRYNRREGSSAEAADAVARRVYGFLMRRGYSSGVCAEVARSYWREAGEE
ncbi:MAG: RecX family transcriptional regulator [Actinomycetota bacterium]|nr:RecX family transcriptional regulator [Actinomycetota bacterium]